MASENNIYNQIMGATGEISPSNYTDVDALVFAAISGIDMEKLLGENSYSYDSNSAKAVYTHSAESYTLEDLLAAYEGKKEKNNGKLSESDQEKYDLIAALAKSERYKNIELKDPVNISNDYYIDENGNEYPVNFKAITIDLGDTKIIAYAGTGNNIFSWLEDLRMAAAGKGIGAQVWGKEYAEFVMNLDDDDIMFAGYSKGGNQAIYSAVNLWPEYSERIKQVINVDGPGYSEKSLQEYIDERTFYEIWQEMCEKGIIDATTTPYDSFVGHLMEDHSEYNYIKGNSWLLFTNHDFENWTIELINGKPSFLKVNSPEMAEVSLALEHLVNGILKNVSQEEMNDFSYVLQDYCYYTKIEYVSGGTRTIKDEAGNIIDEKYSIGSYFKEVPTEEKLKALVTLYNGTDEEGKPYLDEKEKAAFNKVLTELFRDDNLEQFLIAWRKQLESTENEDALALAGYLSMAEPFYPALVGVIQSVDTDELLMAIGVIVGFIESAGGSKALENMSDTDKILAFISYFNSLPSEEKDKIAGLFIGAIGGVFTNSSLSEKKEMVGLFGEYVIDGLTGYAKNHPFITAIGVFVILSILSNPVGIVVATIAAIVMSIVVGIAVIVSLWLEFKDELYEAYIFVRDKILDFMERMVELIESAINKLKNLVKTIIEYIKNKVTEVKEAGKYIVKEKVMEFSDTWSNLMPSPVLKLSAIITYALKNAYETANIHVEFDLGKLSRLVDRLSNAASNARSLESELDSFYSYLKNTKVKVDEKKEITLAKKYRISRNDLDPDKAGTLINASNRLSGAYAKLSRLDGTLLA